MGQQEAFHSKDVDLHFGDLEKFNGHVFFNCCYLPIVWADRRVCVESFFFVREDSSICANVVPSLKQDKDYVLLFLLRIMWVMAWTMKQKECHVVETSSFSQLTFFFISLIISFKLRPGEKVAILFVKIWKTVDESFMHSTSERCWSWEIVGCY